MRHKIGMGERNRKNWERTTRRLKIYQMYKDGYTCAEIAKEFSVPESRVRNYVNWKDQIEKSQGVLTETEDIDFEESIRLLERFGLDEEKAEMIKLREERRNS